MENLKDSNMPLKSDDSGQRDDQIIVVDGKSDNEECSVHDPKKRRLSSSYSERQQQEQQQPPTQNLPLHGLPMPSFLNPFSSIAQQHPQFPAQQQNEPFLSMPSTSTCAGSAGFDLRFPFPTSVSYPSAKEIDASIASHPPMEFRVYGVDTTQARYEELRQNPTFEQTRDPRIEYMHGSSAPPSSSTSDVQSSHSERLFRNTIASSEPLEIDSSDLNMPSTSRNRRQNPTTEHATTAPIEASQAFEDLSYVPGQPTVTRANKQISTIRHYLLYSDWYNSLNSADKIKVNQQLTLVSTELNKFHTDPSPTKKFDTSFITNNIQLQQIFSALHIDIDVNGEVAHPDSDTDDAERRLEYLHSVPPHLFGQSLNLQPFTLSQSNAFLNFLNMSSGAPGMSQNPYNPFVGNVQQPFVGGPGSLLGQGLGPGALPGMNVPMGFANFGMPPNMQQQVNFENARNNQQENQQQRQNNFNGANENI